MPGMRNRLDLVGYRSFTRGAVILLLSVCMATCAWAVTPKVPKPMPEAVRKLLEKHGLSEAKVGWRAWDLDRQKKVSANLESALFNPASTVKLLTGYAMLRSTGPSFSFTTRLDGTAPLTARTMTYVGDLYLIGGGDPSLTWSDLERMAVHLASYGVTVIKGDLIADGTIFDTLAQGKGWMWDEGSSPAYARHSGLAVDEGCVHISVRPCGAAGDTACWRIYPPTYAVSVVNAVRVAAKTDSLHAERRWQKGLEIIDLTGTIGGIADQEDFYVNVQDPALYTAMRFAELMARNGISLTGQIRVGKAPEKLTTLSEVHSRNIDRLLPEMFRHSDNFYAECFLKTLAVRAGITPGSASGGVAEIRRLLGVNLIDTLGWRVVDGSGVSRYNLVTPTLLVDVLIDAWRDFRIEPEFVSALSIAGGEGTMAKRFSDEKGWVRAKTGTMNGVVALAGYYVDNQGNRCAFAILVQDFIGPLQEARDFQDELVKYFQDLK